ASDCRRPALSSCHTTVVMIRVVTSGRMKNVPTVSVTVLGPCAKGTAQSGTESSLAAVPQAMRAFTVALITAVIRTAFQNSHRRCLRVASRHTVLSLDDHNATIPLTSSLTPALG